MPPSTTRRRAAAACEFCRRRKIKCDNAQPICRNCEAYGKECVYVEGEKRPRPSNSRIQELEEQNKRLQQALLSSSTDNGPSPEDSGIHAASKVSPGHSDAYTHTPSTTHASGRTPSRNQDVVDQEAAAAALTEISKPPALSRISYSANGQSSYHGPTSALYDDAEQYKRRALHSATKVPEEYVQRILMAEAAQQRQMEAINYSMGRLDFDGVDPELGMHLLDLHWNRQHHSFLITYRPAFMRDMASGGGYFSKLLLNAIFYGVSKFSPRPEVRKDPHDGRTAGWRFRERIRSLLGQELDKSKITTIQALLVLSSSMFALGDERSAAWLYAGIAFRMIVDLGMHVDAPLLPNLPTLSDEDLEIRRRVFWGAYVVDKLQSLYQGRPVSLQQVDSRVPTTFLDAFEELEAWRPFSYTEMQPYAGSPAYSVSTFTQLCKLSVIMSGILNRVYAERSMRRDAEDLLQDQGSLQEDLDNWRAALPQHLQFSPANTTRTPPPHVLSLLSVYNVLLILLHRPFVAEGHLYSNPGVASKSFLICAAAATEISNILRAYDRAFSFKRAPYLMSYSNYVAATIHVRIAAQRGSSSEAHACLLTCLKMLRTNEDTNWAVRKQIVVIQDLVARMRVEVEEGAMPPPATRVSQPDNVISNEIQQAAPQGYDDQQIAAWSENDLDMDAIIQSFMRDQSSGPMDPRLAGQGPPSRPGDLSVDQTQSSDPPAVDPQYDYSIGGEIDPFLQTGNDMLFGFNNSTFDISGW